MRYEDIYTTDYITQDALALACRGTLGLTDHVQDLESQNTSRIFPGTSSNEKTIRDSNERLLEINLTTFDGDLTKWEKFKDLFKSL
jgi:hypothetical protein